MASFALKNYPSDLPSHFDVVIVGAGAAGLTIANEFVGTSKTVCLLESGGWQRSETADKLNDFESVGRPRATDAQNRCRGVGGTTALWTGRCGEFDPIDYAHRSWLPLSGWPISCSDLTSYQARADQLLNLPPLHSASQSLRRQKNPVDVPFWDESYFNTVAWRFCSYTGSPVRRFASDDNSLGVLQHSGSPEASNLGHQLGPKIAESENVTIITDATVLEVLADEASKAVRGVAVAAPDKTFFEITSEQVILTCGGIENARLLLDSKGSKSAGLGNDQVGRYLTDHTFTVLGTYDGDTGAAVRRRLGTRWINQVGQRKFISYGLGLSADVQRREELLNAAIHIAEFGEKQSAISSIASAARTLKAGGRYGSVSKDLFNGLSQPISLLMGVRDRYYRKTPALNCPDYTLVGCVIEQELNPESRLTLSEKTNWLGQRLPVLDWRFSNREFRTAQKVAELFYAEIDRLGLPEPIRPDWITAGEDAWAETLTDLAHPMCTTRMATNPEEGVVDANCQVHGVAGLFVAGSSVFPTPGHMNPTRQIVALSLRLADHLKSQPLTSSVPSGATAPTSVKQERKMKVAIVGGGNRFQSVYEPVLRALSDHLDVVCVITKTEESAKKIATRTHWKTDTDLGRVIADEAPDFLIVALPDHVIDQTFPLLLNHGIPLLLDTPVCWSVRSGRKLLKKIKKTGQIVGVAEQFPFLPEQQLRRKVIDLGLIGDVRSVVNDFSVYDYHGIALCKSLLGHGNSPVMAHGIAVNEGSDDPWLRGAVFYNGGKAIFHNFASAVHSIYHSQKEVRVYGTSGKLLSEEMVFDHGSKRSPVVRVMQDGCLDHIYVQTPLGKVHWSNPFTGFELDDEQISVATLFFEMCQSVRFGSALKYDVAMALQDVELLAAMRYSANRAGRFVKLPFNETLEKIRSKIIKRIGFRRGINKS